MEVNNYLAAPDHYTDIQEFIREFTGEYNNKYETHWGLDFSFHGKTYHLCRYQMESDEERIEYSKKLNRDLSICEFEFGEVIEDENDPGSIIDIRIMDWYVDVYDMLEHCVLHGMKLKDVLLSDETQLISRD